jgi:LmbE family N-acetylglucosaminyl deacetylase
MAEDFTIVRLVGKERRVASTLSGVSKHWQGRKECFLFISPHDDDIVLGAGLLVQLAVKEKVPVYIMVVTDGSMGYCSLEEKDGIAEIRREETFDCYESLGVPRENIFWLGFPDCRLNYYRGRRPAQTGEATAIEGFVGMQNSFTHYLRKVRPTQCFLPTSNDLHPDHKFVHEELLISIYHAGGAIWPELGKPIEKLPYVHEIACYCDFPTPPHLQIRTSPAMLQKKLDAIRAFRSQRQIQAVVDIVSKAGPVEYIRDYGFRLYSPENYREAFEVKQEVFDHR